MRVYPVQREKGENSDLLWLRQKVRMGNMLNAVIHAT